MRKTIGIVSEGPRDYEMIATIIDEITGEEHMYQHLQPEPNAHGEMGSGWKGVWKWCEAHSEHLYDYFYSITPHLDLLIIHMDGDVARKEKEVHCRCMQEECENRADTHPLTCQRLKDANCPVSLPCSGHGDTPGDRAVFLKAFLYHLTGEHDDLPICFLTPCDSTDTWIVAACDAYEQCEALEEPWERIICRSSVYHGVRMKNRPQKSKGPYQALISKVVSNWKAVIDKCPQANAFEQDVRCMMTENTNQDA